MLESTLTKSIIPSFTRRIFSSACNSSQYGANNAIGPFLFNRNPRNLERLRIAPKPQGYGLDDKFVNYWHRLVIEQSNRHTAAHVEHHQGKVVVSASTKEWAIRQQVRSTNDSRAMELVGQVLAQRCREFGLIEIHSTYKPSEASSKMLLFLRAMEDGGIALSEPERFLPHRHWSREAREKPTHVFEDAK